MPATSKAQGRFFRWAEHNPEQAKSEGKATGMTTSQMHDFAVTPEKGLPEKVAKPAMGALTKTARKRGMNG